MSWRVLKFGGSSLATAEAARAALALVERARREVRPVVVVSALGGATVAYTERSVSMSHRSTPRQ
jgi:aspartokinase